MPNLARDPGAPRRPDTDDRGRPIESRPLHDAELRLPDGRVLGYADHGPVDGVPLLFFHGTPGARVVLSVQALATAARCGVRVVVPERPGYGLSTPHATRTLLSWAADVEALADHLGLERFAVAGASGGGPYALACAYALPARVSLAGLVCTAGRFTGRDDLRRLSPLNRLKFGVPRWAPWLLRADLALLAPVVRRWPAPLTRLMAQRSTGDRAITAAAPDYQARLERLLAESFRQGSAGLYTDLVLSSRDWGFDLRHIDVPVELWHGEEDQMAPPHMARALAEELPNCSAHFLPDGGHLILGRPEVWETLMSRVVVANGGAMP